MTPTPAAVPANQYPAYVHNCKRNRSCEPAWSAPLPGLPYLQLYVDFGVDKPVMIEFNVIDHCNGDTTEQIFPSNYVVGKTPEGNWYGVFKYFNTPVSGVTSFVVWLSATVIDDAGVHERTFFSEMLVVEPCAPLTKIKSCQPEASTTTGFDVNGVYYGLPVNMDYLGIAQVRYFHIAYVRLGKVRELSNKATFKQSLIRNFRTTIEKVHVVETELVPKWYKDELLGIYARGVIQVDDDKQYIVSDLAFEAINDDDLTWKPFAQLKETFRLYYGCDDSVCIECCSPVIIFATVNPDESGSISESASVSSSESTPADPDAMAFIDAVGTLTGPQEQAVINLVTALKSAGVWGKLIAAYPMIGGTAAAHKFNLIDPQDLDASFRLTFAGSWTHSATGALPNGSTAWSNTHLNASVMLSPTSGSLGYYSRTNNNTVLAYDMGCSSISDTQNTIVICRYSDNKSYLNYGSSAFNFIVSMEARGFFCTNRLGAVNSQMYVNGVSMFDGPDAVSLANQEIYVGASNKGGTPGYFGTRECAFAFIGNGLTALEHADLYNAVQSFQTELGRQI